MTTPAAETPHKRPARRQHHASSKLGSLGLPVPGMGPNGLPVVIVSATSAWSTFTVTCFKVICCWPRPRFDQAAQLMSPRYERPFSASSRWISRCARVVPECALYGFSPARERCGHDFNLNKINRDIAQLGMKVIEVSAGEST